MTGVVAPAEQWELLEGAVKGAAKKHSQDRCVARRIADGRAVVLAVADGHGSAPHFRSDLGARWAVEEFLACAGEFAHAAVGHDDPDAPEDDGRWWQALTELRGEARRLPQQISHRWLQRAALHDANSPAHGRPWRTDEGPDLTAYGTTLVGAVLTRRLLVCWQLGDGDIVVLDAVGTPYTPLYTGPDLGDETDSLCAPEAWHRARCHWQPLTREGPSGVLLSTDGLSKSFTDHQGFLDFAAGVHGRAHELGMPAVQNRLPEWLAHAAQFSGDDTTLVGAFEAVGPLGPRTDDAPTV